MKGIFSAWYNWVPREKEIGNAGEQPNSVSVGSYTNGLPLKGKAFLFLIFGSLILLLNLTSCDENIDSKEYDFLLDFENPDEINYKDTKQLFLLNNGVNNNFSFANNILASSIGKLYYKNKVDSIINCANEIITTEVFENNNIIDSIYSYYNGTPLLKTIITDFDSLIWNYKYDIIESDILYNYLHNANDYPELTKTRKDLEILKINSNDSDMLDIMVNSQPFSRLFFKLRELHGRDKIVLEILCAFVSLAYKNQKLALHYSIDASKDIETESEEMDDDLKSTLYLALARINSRITIRNSYYISFEYLFKAKFLVRNNLTKLQKLAIINDINNSVYQAMSFDDNSIQMLKESLMYDINIDSTFTPYLLAYLTNKIIERNFESIDKEQYVLAARKLENIIYLLACNKYINEKNNKDALVLYLGAKTLYLKLLGLYQQSIYTSYQELNILKSYGKKYEPFEETNKIILNIVYNFTSLHEYNTAKGVINKYWGGEHLKFIPCLISEISTWTKGDYMEYYKYINGLNINELDSISNFNKHIYKNYMYRSSMYFNKLGKINEANLLLLKYDSLRIIDNNISQNYIGQLSAASFMSLMLDAKKIAIDKLNEGVKNRNRLILILFTITTIIILFVFIVNYYRKRAIIESKINKYQSKIYLEFVHLTRTSIIKLSKKFNSNQKDIKTGDYLRGLGDFLSKYYRNLTETETVFKIDSDKEIDMVKSYVEHRNQMNNSSIDFQYSIEDNIKIPPGILLSMVKNALEHGKLLSNRKGEIYVKTYIKDKKNFIKVQDNGVGLNVDDKGYLKVYSNSTGLKSIEFFFKYMKLLNKVEKKNKKGKGFELKKLNVKSLKHVKINNTSMPTSIELFY